MSEITVILERVEKGDPKAVGELLPLVYDELRRLAAHKMAAESVGHTLQPTVLVHEAWLRLAGEGGQAKFQNRGHFFGSSNYFMKTFSAKSKERFHLLLSATGKHVKP